jgi:hypothetical protein
MKMNKPLLFSMIGFLAGHVWAADESLIQSDAQVLARWFSEEISHATAFNAAANPQIPADIHSLLGVEVGLSAGVSSTKVDADGFNGLPLQEIKTSGFDVPSDVLLAMPIIHAKVGLPFDLDVGLKYGRLNYDDTNGDAKSEVENSVFGVEIRRRLMGEGATGVILPDVALSLAYDQANGDVKRTERYVGPVTSGGSLNALTTMTSKWQTGAVTARVVASKQLLLFTPYVGAGYSRLMGDADTTVDVDGTDSFSNDVRVSSTGSANADDDILQFLGGCEFSFFPLFKINVGGLLADKDWAATAGVRFSFR